LRLTARLWRALLLVALACSCSERNATVIASDTAVAEILWLPEHAVLEPDVDLIRFGGRINYVDLVSSSFVEESLQVLGGIRVSIQRSLVAAGERPVAI
jgi:hypothetical protein